MSKITNSWRLLAAVAGISMLAACADQSPRPAVAAATPAVAAGPQPAGGWYQVWFDTSKSDLNANGQMIVDSVANAVRRDNAVRVTIIGRTDRVGSEAANMALSEKRAERVRDALIATGMVPADRIETRWMGEGKQGVPTANDVAEQRNRVVDITVQ